MNQLVQQQVVNLITQMANSLGVATEHLWGVLVKQMVAEGYVTLIVCTFFFVVFLPDFSLPLSGACGHLNAAILA